MNKVVKFGGSSLASAEQFKKVGKIITDDKDRHFVVPSAPGKRFSKDKKVTDNGEMSELKILLREKFCELLNLSGDEIDLDSDFFAMGGNSLIAMKLLSQLRETFDVDISLTDLFMTSTIREMKELLEERNAIIKK